MTPSPLPLEHFKLAVHATVAHVLGQAVLSFDSEGALFEQFPFLEAYYGELVGLDAEDDTAADWQVRIAAWEAQVTDHLPLRSLCRAAGLDHEALTLLLCAGLVEEDPRFGVLFEAMQPASGHHRPTVGLLSAWWREPEGWSGVRSTLRHLMDLGLLHVLNPDAPRTEWAVQVPDLLWDVLRGDWQGSYGTPGQMASWVRFRPALAQASLDELIVPDSVRQTLSSLPKLLVGGEAGAIIVRGPHHNGRRTVLGAVARAIGRGTLEVTGLQRFDDERWRMLGPLATMLQAVPVLCLELGPGETCELPGLLGYAGPIGVVLGKQGGLAGPGIDRALTLTLPMPDAAARQRHWLAALGEGHPGATPAAPWQVEQANGVAARHDNRNGKGSNGFVRAIPQSLEVLPENGTVPFSAAPNGTAGSSAGEIAQLARRFRMTGGNLRRTARLAHAYAALAGRQAISQGDAQQAARTLNRQALDALATLMSPLEEEQATDSWHHLAVNAEVMAELRSLESRCRHRENLWQAVGLALAGQLNTGVRALFTGPSGTGKTLAARVLASALAMDLYRLDLSTVVNKYIGETEKNLNQVFSRAEELDVILLLDEGDALLTQRTGVSNANDRYANLETNFLLQRIETYEGILIVTTNAGERIDGAFQRRMDVLVEFRAPESVERQAIWRLHLPEQHAVDGALLEELAVRCALTGGQIRNAALHAALLALRAEGRVDSDHVFEAVQREYRKAGAVSPLRRGMPSVCAPMD